VTAKGETEVSYQSCFLKGSAVCPPALLDYKHNKMHARLGKGGRCIRQRHQLLVCAWVAWGHKPTVTVTGRRVTLM